MHFNMHALGEASSKQYYLKKNSRENSLDIPSMGKDYFLKTNSFFYQNMDQIFNQVKTVYPEQLSYSLYSYYRH